MPDGCLDGRELALGVRPEHLLRADDGGAGAFDAQVDVVEPVGSEVFVNLSLGAHPLVARLPPGDLPLVGQRLPLRVATGRVHLFDPEDGRRLCP